MNRRTVIITAALILVLTLGGFLAAGSSSDSNQAAAAKRPHITFVGPGHNDPTNPTTTDRHPGSTGTTGTSNPGPARPTQPHKLVVDPVPVKTVAVPNVFGDHELAARDKIQNTGLQVVVVRHYVTRPADDDKVTTEIPHAGATVTSGSPVIIDVATYDIRYLTLVPNLIGMDDTTAKTTLTNSKLTAAVSYVQVAYPSKVGVTTQDSAPYTRVVVGTTVHIVVTVKSLVGVRCCVLPPLLPPTPTLGPAVVDVRGQTCAQATAILASEGYVAKCILSRDPAHIGVVFDEIAIGNQRVLGDSIDLWIGTP